MSVDIDGLRSAIRDIKRQIGQLGSDVASLKRIADAAEEPSIDGGRPSGADLGLPPGIRVERPVAVDHYLRAHPDLADVVRELAVELLHEFRADKSEITLDIDDDHFIDEDDPVEELGLVFRVRTATYDDSFMDRLDRVEAPFDDRLSSTSGWVFVTTDHVPVE